MIMTYEELKKHYFGAYSFSETKDGYLASFQYSKAQIEYFEKKDQFYYDRCVASTAKTLEFITSATSISFDYNIIWKGSEDSFELCVDGLIERIDYVKDIPDKGRLEYSMAEGDKCVTIYLPADATVLIKDLEINADAGIPSKNEKVLWLGDSITQGFGPLRSSCTYVSVANRELNYDIINQGIGGYVYDKGSLMKMDGYEPDKIIIALGTNQFGDKSMAPVEEYYERLFEIYLDSIPTLTILPIWRGDVENGESGLKEFNNKVKKICEGYKNIKIIDGFKLVPHLSEYYLDNLHPNVIGAYVYGTNLVKAIKEIGF